MTMSAIKDGRYPVMLDEERKLLFDLNVLDEVNDRFGSLEAMGSAMMDKKDGAKTLRWLLAQMLNEGADDGAQKFTEHQVGKLDFQTKNEGIKELYIE